MSLQLGGKLDNLFYFILQNLVFEVPETSMNGFYQLSVFSLPENIALRTAAKRWGMQSTMEQFFGTDLGSGNPAVQLVSIFFLYKHLPGAKQSLSVFPLFNYRLQLQNLSLFCKNCERRNASSSPTEHRYRVFYEICDSLVPN